MKTTQLQFGWHSHVPYVLNENNYYSEDKKAQCSKWILDSVNGFSEFYKIFRDNKDFKSFISISGQTIEQFLALAEMSEETFNFLRNTSLGELEIMQVRDMARNMLQNTRHYVANGRLELIGTAYNHSIMPFLSVDDFRNEVEKILRAFEVHFGVTDVQGFFPPESCITERDIEIYQACGIKYLVLEDPTYMDTRGGFRRRSGNFYSLDREGEQSRLGCFHRNRAISLLSWLSEYENIGNTGKNNSVRQDVQYARLDGSVDNSILEFEDVFTRSKHTERNSINPEQFADIVKSLSINESDEGQEDANHSLMLFTDHEYLGSSHRIFPLINQAIGRICEANSKEENLSLQFCTLNESYRGIENTKIKKQTVSLLKGSWCSGLMLADAYLKDIKDNQFLYSHGTICEPFANWKSYSYHYDLISAHMAYVFEHMTPVSEASDHQKVLINQITSLLDVTKTSCFYGWFPPVYRLKPAYTLLMKLHGILADFYQESNENTFVIDVAWHDGAIKPIISRIQQLKMSDSAHLQPQIREAEKKIQSAKTILKSGVNYQCSIGYRHLCEATDLLEEIFELIDSEERLFMEPNNPWDLWDRKLVDGVYV
ncbi:hypothetical protein KIH87_10560 [Paraneptunicella aestuarii]|uniref:hypothetical protein n=1 Tax=Paraneptunicella aestuarii TaxID=2831148 RepID=UPI001E3F5E22|nr:hypothetical protein [Paraneptunicella aestuarii]UAA37190.1 hypothetical protein KIH87_10560 [Paraneptunicella aestuarii]